MSQSNKKVLLIVTGSIASYKAAELTSLLVKNRFQVKVAMSKGAQNFISPTVFEALSSNPVEVDLWKVGTDQMAHIHLARWADIIICAPCTANQISKMATGGADTLTSSLFMAHDFSKPFLVAPAMNQAMYKHPLLQENIQKLKKLGLVFLDSPEGDLACKEVGPGRLQEPDQIFFQIQRHLNKIKNHTIIITSGGTEIAIDSVRTISNISSGKSGVLLAKNLFLLGFDIILIKSALSPNGDIQEQMGFSLLTFKTPDELSQLVTNTLYQLPNATLIHMAAVSDFELSQSSEKDFKLDSGTHLKLDLIPRKKLIDEFKKITPHSLVIGFKLTVGLSHELEFKKVTDLINRSQCDYVVHNDLIKHKNKTPVYTLYNKSNLSKDDNPLFYSISELATGLSDVITSKEKL